MGEVSEYFDSSVNNDFDTLVEETIVCSSSGYEDDQRGVHDHDQRNTKKNSNKLCGNTTISLGSSKVYSSVVVAPSFSASDQC